MRRALVLGAGALVFVVVATLNTGGYRYGSADQAFYIPAILSQLDPALFPRDTALIGPQARYFFVDEIVATAVRASGWSIEAWFLVGYTLSMVMLYAALLALGRAVFVSPLAVAALLAAETLRHRITKTGVNTLEGYFHPRILVFAVGIAGIVCYLRGRPWLGLGMVVVGGLLHPTTAAFFVLFLGAAMWTTDPQTRRGIGVLTTLSLVAVAALVLAGPWADALQPMDAEWRAVFAGKDYLFPTRDWTLASWLTNLGTAALAIGGLSWRVRHGVGHSRERGLVAGAAVLLTGFLVTLPAVAAGSALFVQLQISRVFWILDLLAVVVVVGALVDGRTRARLAVVATALLVLLATARGLWVTLVDHSDRSAFAYALPDNDWTRTLQWLDTQPRRTHVLADPGHAWRFGAPVRYAGRDVLVEDTKDAAMSIYSRASAMRVAERLAAVGDFSQMTAEHARALATRYNLHYLIIDRELPLPLQHQEGLFRVYTIR